MHPFQLVNGGPKSVLDVLRVKHSEPSHNDVQAFLDCDDLPPLTEVDVTGSLVEQMARRIHGGAGPGGSTAIQWQHFLLRCGSHSAKLRDDS